MKNICCLLLVSFTLFINAQISYEKGYFIDNDNNKVECFIKNSDWLTSPNQISYKITLDSDKKEISISDMIEFSIYNTEHYYKKFNISIDEMALSDFNNNSRELNYSDKVDFLRVLVSGKANLYEHPGTGIFFFNLDNEKVNQFQFKKYISKESIKKENKDYQRQLFEVLKCDNFSTEKFLKVKHTRKDLIKLFSDYNECQNSEYKTYQANKTPVVFNVNAQLGINFTTLETEYTILGHDTKQTFDSQTVFTPGIELELVFPFHKNKWAVFAGATYHNFKESKEDVIILDTDLGEISFEYSYLEIPLGIRHYMYLNSDYKLYLSVAFAPVMHLSNNNEEPFTREEGLQGDISFEEKNATSNTATIIGVGCNFKSKFSLGLNYYTAKKINNSKDYSNNMNGAISLIASYTLF